MRANRLHHILLACLLALTAALPLSGAAVAATSRISGASAYAQLHRDFERVLTLPDSEPKADQVRFEKTTAPCLTSALATLFEAQAPGSLDAGAAAAAFKPLLYEAAIQMVMRSSKPFLIPMVHAVRLAVRISGLTGSDRTKVLALADVLAAGPRLRTCADATAWAATGYSTAGEPQGLKESAGFAKVVAGVGAVLPDRKLTGVTSTQTTALDTLVKQAEKRFQSAVKRIDTSGAHWLDGVVVQAEQEAQQHQATTTTTTPTTTTPTTTTATTTTP